MYSSVKGVGGWRRYETGETLAQWTKSRRAHSRRHHWHCASIARRVACSDFEIMSSSRSQLHRTNVHPSGTSCSTYVVIVAAGVVVLEVPDSHPSAVGLGSQKSKDERGPPHQGANGYHTAFLLLSTRYPEPSSPSTRVSRDSCLVRSTAWSWYMSGLYEN